MKPRGSWSANGVAERMLKEPRRKEQSKFPAEEDVQHTKGRRVFLGGEGREDVQYTRKAEKLQQELGS